MKKPANNAASTFNDYATMLALMRSGVATTCDLDNPRMADFHHALEVAWTAAMLLVMQANEEEMDVAAVA